MSLPRSTGCPAVVAVPLLLLLGCQSAPHLANSLAPPTATATPVVDRSAPLDAPELGVADPTDSQQGGPARLLDPVLGEGPDDNNTLADTSAQAASPLAKTAVQPVAVQWVGEFESAGQRPIQTVTLGAGPRKVCVMGSLSGNEDRTVAAVEQFAGRLAAASHTNSNLTVLCIRTPNPDGFAEHTRTNSRGVDLNRDFAAPAGTSQPETVALTQLLKEFTPDRVIHVVQGSTNRGVVRTDAAVSLASDEWLVEPAAGSLKTGSIEEYVVRVLHAEAATVLMSIEEDSHQERKTVEQLITLCAVSGLDLNPQVDLTAAAQSASRSATAHAQATQPEIPRGRKGYVQILPPPPGLVAPIGQEHRYFELPPPPAE